MYELVVREGRLSHLILTCKLHFLSLQAIICAWTLPILFKIVLLAPESYLIAITTWYYGARRLRFSLKARHGNSARKLSAAGKKRELCSSELLTYGKRSTAYSW